MSSQFQPHRYLGLDLAGAKNQKTTLAALEFYPKEKKTFLLDIYDRIGPSKDESGDETLIRLVRELAESHPRDSVVMGVNVPLELPPCLPCEKKTCPTPSRCTVPAVRWMRECLKKGSRSKSREITPYTQRPVELWLRTQLLPKFPERLRFDVDEAIGGNKGPLTARMVYLKRHLRGVRLVETWPKLTIAALAAKLGVSPRLVTQYRKLESGAYARSEILDLISEKCGIFVYEKDAVKISQNLIAFDAFLCALTALLSDTGQCARPPRGFPAASGWVQYPEP